MYVSIYVFVCMHTLNVPNIVAARMWMHQTLLSQSKYRTTMYFTDLAE